MNLKVMNLKWLAVIFLMCAPTIAWADDESGTVSLDLSNLSEVANSGTLTTNDESIITMSFTTDCYDQNSTSYGIGWKSSEPDYLNLSDYYSEIIVNYSEFTTDYYDKEIQLYIVDSNGYGVSVASSDKNSSSGTIDFVFSDNPTGRIGWGNEGQMTYSSVEYLLICVHLYNSASVTIDSIELVPNVSSGDEGGGEEGGDGDEIGDEGGDVSGSTNIPDNATTLDISNNDQTLKGNGDNIYHITDDGTDGGYTILFPEDASGDYTIYFDNVTIDIANRTDDIAAALEIPENVTVTFYVNGTCYLYGKTFGIKIDEGASFTMYTESDEDLHIKGDYGVYCLGNKFFVHSDTGASEDVVYGTTTIEAKYCGIYFGATDDSIKYQVTCNNLTINVTADASDLEALGDDALVPAVSGIYNANTSGSQVDLSMETVIIYVPGEGTYGTFSNTTSGIGFYFGFGTYIITATKCVMHHPDGTQYSGGYVIAENNPSGDQYVILQFNGPFCWHLESTWTQDVWNSETGQTESVSYSTWWCCDGGSGTSKSDDIEEDGASGGTGFSYSQQIISIDDANDYNGISGSVDNAYEVEYYDRMLRAGWNTLSLPCQYKLSATDSDSKFDGTEARTVISAFATYDSWSEDTSEDAYAAMPYLLSFTKTEKGEGGWEDDTILEADKAYLVYVPEDTEGLEDDYILVKFTSMSTPYASVYSDYGEVLRTVYKSEVMYADGTIANDKTGTNHYKLDHGYDAEGNLYSYFNQPLDDNGSSGVAHFRAYLNLDDISDFPAGGNAKSIGIKFDDGETTSISEIYGGARSENGELSVYSLDGKLVKVATEKGVANGLSKGVYIIGGKKVVVM